MISLKMKERLTGLHTWDREEEIPVVESTVSKSIKELYEEHIYHDSS